MKYSMYIGRVGALAVALGIGAAVATTPGIALAEGTESDQGAGAEAPPSPPATEPQVQTPGIDGSNNEGDGLGVDIDPPDMNVSGSVVDTSTHDENTGASGDEEEQAQEEEEEAESEVEEPSGEEPEVAPDLSGGDGAQVPAGGSGSNLQGFQQLGTQSTQRQQFTPNLAADAPGFVDTQRKASAADVDNTSFRSLSTPAFDDSSAEAATFSSLALDESEAVVQDPISALITLPLRIVSSVLTAVIGGTGVPGENPLLWGVLAFVRRQFDSFGRTFSNQAPVIDDYSLVENPDGTFTVTIDTEQPDVDAFDPDGDQLTFSAIDGEEGTVVKTAANTFVYTPGADFDGDDEFTLSVSDPGGLFGVNSKTDSIIVEIDAGEADPTEPEVVQPPTRQPDGSFEAKLEFDPEQVTDVTVAPGFEPTYWNVTPVYNPETGEFEVKLTPNQAGQLRAFLGLPTTDSLGLAVTTTEQQTFQTFALRSASFAALAEEPDYTMALPTPPAAHFEVSDPEIPVGARPAGVVVTDKYAYVINSNLDPDHPENFGQPSTVSVIGADPDDTATYRQVVKVIEVGETATFAGLAGDRLYVVSSPNFAIADSTVTIIDTDGATSAVEDDNTIVDADPDDGESDVDGITLPRGAFNPLVSPDGKTVYVMNLQEGKVYVIDADPTHVDGDPNTADTYNTVVAEIPVATQVTQNPDGTMTFQLALSGAFNDDGSRLYVVRDSQTLDSLNDTATFKGELVIIDTATNTVIDVDPNDNEGDIDAVDLGQYGGYAASAGGRMYVPSLDYDDLQDLVFLNPGDPLPPAPPGYVTVVDIETDPDNPTVVDLIPVGKMAINVAFSPDKSLAYVVNGGDGTISVIDTATNEVLDLDPEELGVQGIVFDEEPTGQLGDGNVVAISPDGRQLFVSNYKGHSVISLAFVEEDV